MSSIQDLERLGEESENLKRSYEHVKQYGVTMDQLKVFDKINRVPYTLPTDEKEEADEIA